MDDDRKWLLRNPLYVVHIPADAKFPFRVEELAVFAQLTDGIGRFDLRVEMRQILDDGSRRTVGWSSTVALDFPPGSQILAYGAVFRLRKVPFREPGLYEFRVTTDDEQLQGLTAELRVLDRRSTL